MSYLHLTKPEAESLREVRRRVGANLQRARMARGLRLEVCAAHCGLPQSRLDLYETGGGDIALHELVKLAYRLRMTVAELFA